MEDLLHPTDVQQLTEDDESGIVRMGPPEIAQLGVDRNNLRQDRDWRDRDNDLESLVSTYPLREHSQITRIKV